jgi:hypothetical protein
MFYRAKFYVLLCVLIITVACSASPVTGLTITEPKPGSQFHAGDKVIVKAVTAPNERPIAVFLFSTQMHFSTLNISPPYELVFTIPKAFTGEDTIVASAKFSDGSIVESKMKIFVTLPVNVILKGVDVDPNPVYLYKMPINSDSNDVRIFETKSLGVGGMYSDGVERNITSSQRGTTYTSSNEKVVTVSLNGKVTAQSIGMAKIIVRNGKFSADVEVIVDPYKE